MAAGQPQVVLAFAQALTELVTVEKKNIVVLTEIARDALRTEPAAAPSLAALICTRILQARAAWVGTGQPAAAPFCVSPPRRLLPCHAAMPLGSPADVWVLTPPRAGAAAPEAARPVPAGQHLQAGGRALQDAVRAHAARGAVERGALGAWWGHVCACGVLLPASAGAAC